MVLQMMNIIKKSHDRKRKSSQAFLAAKFLVTSENSQFREIKKYLSSLIFFVCGVIFIKPTETILIASFKLNPFTWTFNFFRD